MNRLFYFCLFLLGAGLYFGTARDLMLVRGEFAIGGEAVLLFLPFIVKAVVAVLGGERN